MGNKKDTPKTHPILSGEIERIPIDTLIPHPANPRQGNIGAIIKSIEANGFYGCIVAQEGTNRIIAGYHRWEAARQLAIKQVPVMYLKVDDERALRILLADNKTNDEASYDEPKLVEALQVLLEETRSLDGTGFDEEELQDLLNNLEPDKDDVNFEVNKKKHHIILVECKSAAEQKRTMQKLTRMGLTARIED